MDSETKRLGYIRTAGIIALVGNLLLAATKLLLARISSSLAVMGDAIDSSSDVLIALATLFVGFIIAHPSDKEHPWGHGRAETTASMFLAFVIFAAGIQIVASSANKILFVREFNPVSSAAILASVISIAGKTLLCLLQFHYGKKADSVLVKANALNMKGDIFLSAGVLAGLFCASFFERPFLDPLAALLIGLWIVKNSVMLLWQTNMELMDGNCDSELYEKIFEAVGKVDGVENPHKARIRKIASLYDIDLDIEVDPSLTIYDAHELSEKVEAEICRSIPEIYDIVIHIEPMGSDAHQPKEKFGLSEKELHSKN